MSAPKQLLYATLGFGDLAIEKARNLRDLRSEAERISFSTLDRFTGGYQKLVRRGEQTYKGIRNSAPTKRAMDQTKTARTQTKAAVTSVKKAATAAAEATKEAGTKVG